MLRVLLVDDEESFLDVTKFFLVRDGGIDVETAKSAKEAMAKLAGASFDAIVADYLLPEMDGIEFLKVIRAQGTDIPFILLTGKGKEGVAIEALNNGADFYLEKGTNPVTLYAELIHSITKAVALRQSEEALRESEQRYRMLAETSPEFIYIVGIDGRVIYVNTFAASQLRLPSEEIVGKSLDAIFPPEMSQRLISNVRRVIADGKTLHAENKIIYPDREAWLDTVLVPLRDQKGEVNSVLGLSRDVTEHRASEEALRSSESKLRMITDSFLDMVAQIDYNGVYLYASQSHKSVLGYDPADLIGKMIIEFVHPDDRPMVQASLESAAGASAARDSTAIAMKVRFRHSDGQFVWLECVGNPTYGDDGKPSGGIIVGRDVTARQVTEEALKGSERFLNSIFTSILDGISILDKNLNILRVNPTMENWYSHKMPLIGKRCYDAYHGRHAQCDSCPSIRTIESGESSHEVVPKTGPKGEVLGWLDLYSFPMRDNKTGELSGVIEYVRDITDQRRAEAELRSALEIYKELQGIIDKSPVLLITWRPGPGSPVSYISENISQFGYRREDFVSTYLYDDIIYKEDLEREREEFRDLVGKGANDFLQEYRIVTKSGEVRYVEDHTYVRRDSDGKPLLYEGIVIDVTARKVAQQKSEELTSRLQAIVESFPDLYFHIDADGTILDFNAGRIADLYVPPQKFLGRKLPEVLPPDVGKMYEHAHGEVLKTGRIVTREYSLDIQGETRYFEARLAPIAKKQVLIVVRNITAGKRAAEALEVANQKLNLLGQVTRHDALNQLAILMGWLQIAQESAGEPPLKDHIKNMTTAAETLIRQLDFTGDYQRMGVAKPEWLDVKTAFLNGTAGFSPNKLEMSVHVDGLEVYADTMFEKVLHNLVDNSIRHGKKVTEIRVHCRKKGNDMLLFYEDDGVGILADVKDKIFQRGTGDHTGFGLFLAKAILGITGITIEENGIPGHGVRFEMLVPAGKYRKGHSDH